MKKFLLLLFLMIFICFPVKSHAIATNSSYSVKVYFFYNDKDKDFNKAKEWLEEYQKDSFINVDYLNIDESKELYSDVRKSLKIKNNKMPFIIIGSNYFIGFNNKIKENLTKVIKAYEKAEKNCDIVSKIRNKENIKECIKVNKNIYNQSTRLPTFVIIIIILVGVCLIIGTNLIIKKKKILSRLHK